MPREFRAEFELRRTEQKEDVDSSLQGGAAASTNQGNGNRTEGDGKSTTERKEGGNQ